MENFMWPECHIYASVNWLAIGSGNGLSLLGAKPLAEPMLTYCQLDPWEQISVNWKSNIFIHENAFENVVCEMAAILSRGNELNAFDRLL